MLPSSSACSSACQSAPFPSQEDPMQNSPCSSPVLLAVLPLGLCRRWTARHVQSAVGLILLAIVWAGTSPASAQSLPADAKATCTVTAAVFASWFETGTVSLNGVV